MSIPDYIKLNIIRWKSQYGSIYLAEIEGISIAYRGLTLNEMLTLQDYGKVDDIFEQNVVDLCVLAPKPLTFQKAGSITVLSNQIRELSNWEDPDIIIEHIEKKKKELEQDAISFICKQIADFFGYDIQKIEDMTFDTFVDHCAMMELISGKQLFQRKTDQVSTKRDQVLNKLGARRESVVTVPGAIYRDPENHTQEAMDIASNALKQKIQQEKSANLHTNPSPVFDWESDLKAIKDLESK